jgi:Cys-tRNA synthase (O-phospho-L-seryl-tRNA:Cys-tRNA synthase)
MFALLSTVVGYVITREEFKNKFNDTKQSNEKKKKKFVVTEVDRDYNTVSDSKIMEFETQQEADAWCRNETWTGHYYYNKALEEK